MSQGPPQTRSGTGGPTNGPAETQRGDPELLGRLVAGKYKIEKFLGGGAMGAVYKARQPALEKNVAVKVMHRAIAVDPNFVGRFHREAKAASRLDHPNSMRVIDFGEEPDGLLYITMEYVEGRDLYRVIHEDWPISNADLSDILMQALAALAVAHEMGVIHRDLKPENLMILRAKNDEEKDAYVVKVCDFGIAKITEVDDDNAAVGGAGRKLTTQGLVVGTPEYMSPEQAKGEKLDARSDIYSMGVILYQLLTGRTPFTGDTALAIVLKHITENPAPPSVHYPGVHKGLESVAMRAMAKDRDQRFQTARAMRNAIREALDNRPAPVDTAAETAVGMPNVGGPSGGTAPIVIAEGKPISPSKGRIAVDRAPTVAGAVSASTLRPLGSMAGSSPPQKSRAGLLVTVVVLAGLAAGGALAGPRVLREIRRSSDRVPPPVTPAVLASSSAIAPAPTTNASAPQVANAATPQGAPTTVTTTEAPGPKHAGAAPLKHGATAKPTEPPAAEPASPAAKPAPAEPAPAPEPAATAPASAAAPAPPPAASPAPAAPAFNPQTCRAAVGAPRGTGATNSKDLSLNGTAAAWSSCAQRAFRERPAAPIAATVHLLFTDNKAFRGASCAGCPPPLAQCVASSTQRTVSVNFKGGDVTGDPAFDVPVTFTCD